MRRSIRRAVLPVVLAALWAAAPPALAVVPNCDGLPATMVGTSGADALVDVRGFVRAPDATFGAIEEP